MLVITQTIGHGLQIGPVFLDFRKKSGQGVTLAIDAPQVFRISRNNAAPDPAKAYRQLTSFHAADAHRLADMIRQYYSQPANFRLAFAATQAAPEQLTVPEIGTLQLLAQSVLRVIQAELPHHEPPTAP